VSILNLPKYHPIIDCWNPLQPSVATGKGVARHLFWQV